LKKVDLFCSSFVHNSQIGNRLDVKNVPFPEVQDLMKKCWSEDPKSRPSFEEIHACLLEVSSKYERDPSPQTPPSFKEVTNNPYQNGSLSTSIPSFYSSQQQWDNQWCSRDIQIKSNEVAERVKGYDGYRTAMGVLPNSSFKIKMVKWRYGYIGMAPREGIQLEGVNLMACGWHLRCFIGRSGWVYSQQGDDGREFIKEKGAIEEGGVVEVVLEEEVVAEDREVLVKAGWNKGERDETRDTKTTVKEGENIRKISFVINGKNYGVAFDNIPLEAGDLYPCVQLCDEGDSVMVLD
jgi:hypothetical protein